MNHMRNFGLSNEVFAGSCNLSTTSVAFGAYDVLSSSLVDTTGNVRISCNGFVLSNAIVSIGPSSGTTNINPRTMKLTTGSDLLEYYLYSDSGRTTVWGNGTSGTSTQTVFILGVLFFTRDLTIYGRMLPGQNVSVGTYTDSLVVTITY